MAYSRCCPAASVATPAARLNRGVGMGAFVVQLPAARASGWAADGSRDGPDGCVDESQALRSTATPERSAADDQTLVCMRSPLGGGGGPAENETGMPLLRCCPQSRQ